MNALAALLDPTVLLPSLLASLLAAVACGLTGPLVVSRRLVFLVGAIAHVAIGGVGAAIFLQHHLDWSWLEPIYGALLAALAAAALLSTLRHLPQRASLHYDTLIGALWASGMAIGLLLVQLTPGYHSELMQYLFGYLAAANWGDVHLLLLLNTAIIATLLIFHKRLVAAALDVEHLRLQGLSIWFSDLILLSMVALSVVALTRVVGLILVIALLALPAAAAGHLLRRLGPIMALSVLFCLLLVSLPRIAVYGLVAPEPVIVICAGFLYLITLALRKR